MHTRIHTQDTDASKTIKKQHVWKHRRSAHGAHCTCRMCVDQRRLRGLHNASGQCRCPPPLQRDDPRGEHGKPGRPAVRAPPFKTHGPTCYRSPARTHAALRRRKLRLLRGAAACGGGWSLRLPHIGRQCCMARQRQRLLCALPLDGAAAMHRFLWLLQATTLGAGAAKAAQIRCRATVAARLPSLRAACCQHAAWATDALAPRRDADGSTRRGIAGSARRCRRARPPRILRSAPSCRRQCPPPLPVRLHHPPSSRPDTRTRGAPTPLRMQPSPLASARRTRGGRGDSASRRRATGCLCRTAACRPWHGTARRWMDAVRCASARTTSSAPTPSPTPRCRRPDRRSSNGSAMHRCVRRSSRTMSGRSSRTSCARACATTSQSRYG